MHTEEPTRRKSEDGDRPFHEDDRLLLGPDLLERLRVDLPAREDVVAEVALHGRFYARLARDVGARLEPGLRAGQNVALRYTLHAPDRREWAHFLNMLVL